MVLKILEEFQIFLIELIQYITFRVKKKVLRCSNWKLRESIAKTLSLIFLKISSKLCCDYNTIYLIILFYCFGKKKKNETFGG